LLEFFGRCADEASVRLVKRDSKLKSRMAVLNAR
jgi:hypothetical protein